MTVMPMMSVWKLPAQLYLFHGAGAAFKLPGHILASTWLWGFSVRKAAEGLIHFWTESHANLVILLQRNTSLS